MDEQIPATVIIDKAKAEEMAYAEKPFREDVIAIDGLVKRAYEQQSMLVDDVPPSGDSKSMTNNYHIRNQDHNEKIVHLLMAKHKSINVANATAENAKQRYEVEHPDAAK